MRRKHDEKRDETRLFAAFGPVCMVAATLAGCPRESSTVLVPMLSATDAVFDAGDPERRDGGGAELEPSPPDDAFACRRDVACRASLLAAAPSPAVPGGPSRALPSPFERCSPYDDSGRAFSARETRDARITDPARCCYVTFLDCVRGKR